ncbi:Scr1 family TA system antitoxin-like transcriptional regulator [Streptomyces sp. NPDC050121]|uniref:DUF397 domain-containing protein n=1 Tax=Streptomyces sp. NPDC050121 TaxID=3365601 RepID=UPI0037A211C2
MGFGGREVARAQLDHVMKMSEQPHVTVRVIPFDGTAFPTVGHGLHYAHGPVPALDTAQLDAAHAANSSTPSHSWPSTDSSWTACSRPRWNPHLPATSSSASPKTPEGQAMTELNWQKSTYSEEASSCIYLAVTPTGTILLRESDELESVLTTSTPSLAALIASLQTAVPIREPQQ